MLLMASSTIGLNHGLRAGPSSMRNKSKAFESTMRYQRSRRTPNSGMPDVIAGRSRFRISRNSAYSGPMSRSSLLAYTNRHRRRPAVGGNRNRQLALAMDGTEAESAMLRIIYRIAQDLARSANSKTAALSSQSVMTRKQSSRSSGEKDLASQCSNPMVASCSISGTALRIHISDICRRIDQRPDLARDLISFARDNTFSAGKIEENRIAKIHTSIL